MSLIICVGISGAGKSTWSEEYIESNPGVIRINRDQIRKTMIPNLRRYYDRTDLKQIEDIATQIEYGIFREASRNRYKIILDNTNLNEFVIESWTHRCHDIKFKIFDISLEEAKTRVKSRDGINTDYIDKQFKQFNKIVKRIDWLIEFYPERFSKL